MIVLSEHGRDQVARLEQGMKVNYDAKTDTLTVVFREVPGRREREDKPGVILDCDAAGNIVSIEVLDASSRVEEPRKVTVPTEGRPEYISVFGSVSWARVTGGISS
jgi:uncharacterized protein YuzE